MRVAKEKLAYIITLIAFVSLTMLSAPSTSLDLVFLL
jgi:hypothetical protein